jgi:hypothetical protein
MAFLFPSCHVACVFPNTLSPGQSSPVVFVSVPHLSSSLNFRFPANRRSRRLMSLSPHISSSPNFRFPANRRSSFVSASPSCFVSPLSSSISASHPSRFRSRSSSHSRFFASPASLLVPASLVPAWSAGVPLSFPPVILTRLQASFSPSRKFCGCPHPPLRPRLSGCLAFPRPSLSSHFAGSAGAPIPPHAFSSAGGAPALGPSSFPIDRGTSPSSPPPWPVRAVSLSPLVPPLLSQTWLPLSSIWTRTGSLSPFGQHLRARIAHSGSAATTTRTLTPVHTYTSLHPHLLQQGSQREVDPFLSPPPRPLSLAVVRRGPACTWHRVLSSFHPHCVFNGCQCLAQLHCLRQCRLRLCRPQGFLFRYPCRPSPLPTSIHSN